MQLTDKAMKEGKGYPNASTVSPKANDPKPSEHSSLTHVSASTVLGTRTLSELLLCVDPSAGPSLLSLAAQRSLSIMSSKHLFLGFTYSSLPTATADSQVTILLLSSRLHSGHSPAQQTQILFMVLSSPSKMPNISPRSVSPIGNQLLPLLPASPLPISFLPWLSIPANPFSAKPQESWKKDAVRVV